MSIALDDVELRVLGVLIEKSLTQASSYPLTLNAIVLGANQKQNREPVVSYTEKQVAIALYSLERRQLVKQAPPTPGARANRFAHNVVETFHWDRREQAIMAELMLRGRQTAGELRTRASRMTPLTDLEVVGTILQGLMTGDPPFVKELRREPGRSANRFQHVLSVHATSVSGIEATADEEQSPTIHPPETDVVRRLNELEARVASLEQMVTELRQPSTGSVRPIPVPGE